MSGERVGVLVKRARVFLELAKELISKKELDLAVFLLEQACQLRIKAFIYRLTGEIPRIHGIRELLGVIVNKLIEVHEKDEAEKIRNFVRKNRDLLVEIEYGYTEARYGFPGYTSLDAEEMVKTVEELFKLIEEVEGNVFVD